MLNIERERIFEQIRDKCRILKIPSPPEIFVDIELFNSRGEKIRSNRQRGNSWTRNYYNYFFGALTESPGGNSNNFGVGYMSGKRTSGTIDYSNTTPAGRNSAAYAGGWIYSGANESAGIVIGTSDAAFDEDHYTLQSLITHGVDSGKMLYVPMVYPVISYAAKVWTSRAERFFYNYSGGSIDVKETGLYIGPYFFSSGTYYYMVERNVLVSTVTVANQEVLKVAYDVSMDFSAID